MSCSPINQGQSSYDLYFKILMQIVGYVICATVAYVAATKVESLALLRDLMEVEM